MKTSFVQPGFAGSRLTASGYAFHRSSTLAFCEGEVRDATGRLIARSMGTFKYVRQRPAEQPADGQWSGAAQTTEAPPSTAMY
jgi:acyl-CoA thioesterase